MFKRFRSAFRAFMNPNQHKEMLDLIETMYKWTKYKETDWAIRAEKVLRKNNVSNF